MFKSEESKQIERLAEEYRKKDKRLSWETCVKRARNNLRLFNRK